jgi:hypothetical protein
VLQCNNEVKSTVFQQWHLHYTQDYLHTQNLPIASYLKKAMFHAGPPNCRLECVEKAIDLSQTGGAILPQHTTFLPNHIRLLYWFGLVELLCLFIDTPTIFIRCSVKINKIMPFMQNTPLCACIRHDLAFLDFHEIQQEVLYKMLLPKISSVRIKSLTVIL